MSWSTFLEAAPPGDHAVQVYDDLADLGATVAQFCGAGFRLRQPALLIAAADNRAEFVAELTGRGWDVEMLQDEGRLVLREAAETLDEFMDGGLPAPTRFEKVVGGMIDELAARFPGATIRAFGEMVDVLWQRGEKPGAIALEELWNELAATRRFALLCGYHLDVFDLEVQAEALPDIVRAHTHPRTAVDSSTFAAAVDLALTEIVGSRQAGETYLQVAEHVPRTELPRPQAVLTWLSGQDAPTAKRVLDRARRHYNELRAAH
jgi:MEDS: MEthanogen/methylotroph, DcmR Sensory domain